MQTQNRFGDAVRLSSLLLAAPFECRDHDSQRTLGVVWDTLVFGIVPRLPLDPRSVIHLGSFWCIELDPRNVVHLGFFCVLNNLYRRFKIPN